MGKLNLARRIRNCFLLALVSLWLTACASSSGLESGLYKIDAGPHAVTIANDIVLADPVHERDVSFRVLFPDAGGSYPVVVHSHGGSCKPENYDLFLAHWASHGYIVIAPNHPDSLNSAQPPTPEVWATIVPRRLRDLSFALDALDEITAAAAIPGQANAASVAVTGHSFGAGMALMKSGMFILDEYRAPWSRGYDERFRAGIYFSAPGGNEPGNPDDALDGLTLPFMATGGSKDQGRLDPGDMSLADFRRQVFLRAPAGDKYSVILEDADHYLGGLICNPERGGKPDPEAVAIINAMTTAFLDAYLKQDAPAKSFLASDDAVRLTDGRADYRRR